MTDNKYTRILNNNKQICTLLSKYLVTVKNEGLYQPILYWHECGHLNRV